MKKKIIIIVVVIVVILAIMFSGKSEEAPKFDEQELVGKTLIEAEPILDESGYALTVLSETGAELNNDLDSIKDWQLEQWYVYDCKVDPSAGTVEIVIITQNSDLFDAIK